MTKRYDEEGNEYKKYIMRIHQSLTVEAIDERQARDALAFKITDAFDVYIDDDYVECVGVQKEE